jgi:hypothetical protein
MCTSTAKGYERGRRGELRERNGEGNVEEGRRRILCWFILQRLNKLRVHCV